MKNLSQAHGGIAARRHVRRRNLCMLYFVYESNEGEAKMRLYIVITVSLRKKTDQIVGIESRAIVVH